MSPLHLNERCSRKLAWERAWGRGRPELPEASAAPPGIPGEARGSPGAARGCGESSCSSLQCKKMRGASPRKIRSCSLAWERRCSRGNTVASSPRSGIEGGSLPARTPGSIGGSPEHLGSGSGQPGSGPGPPESRSEDDGQGTVAHVHERSEVDARRAVPSPFRRGALGYVQELYKK